MFKMGINHSYSYNQAIENMGSTEIKDNDLRPNRHFSLQKQTVDNLEHTTPVISDCNLLEQRMIQVIIKLFNLMSNLFKPILEITERMF